MLRLILGLVVVLIVNFVKAQPVITSPFTPAESTVYNSYTIGNDNTGNFLWVSGTNVFWDLPISGGYKDVTRHYKKMDSIAYNPVYPNATHYTYSKYDSIGDFTYTYFYASPDSFCLLGDVYNHPNYTWTRAWVDPYTIVKYPVTYNDSFDETGRWLFVARDTNNKILSTAYTWKYSKVVADGYGTLRFNNRQYDSVLRLRVSTTIINKWYIGHDTGIFKNDTTIETSLVWLSNARNGPIVTIMYRNLYGINKQYFWAFYDEAKTLGTHEIIAESSIQVFPNPSLDAIYINTDSQNLAIAITDITGKKISQHTLQDQQLSITHLSPGIYFLQFFDGGEYVGTKKIVKE